MSRPLIATAPGASTRCCAFSVITVPPTTTSETARRLWAPTLSALTSTAVPISRRFMLRPILSARFRRGSPTITLARLPRPHALRCIVAPVPVHIVNHPLVHDALVSLRDKETQPEEFRRAATRISVLLAAEALRSVATTEVTVETPLGPAPGRRIGRDVVVVPVLRAGLGMLDAVLELVPTARVGHIGLQRDELTAVASQYYSKLPSDLDTSYVLIIDPMLATGGSAVAALDLLQKDGATAIRIVCIVAAPEGIAVVEQQHPTVEIYTPVVDRMLNEHKYIVPGLGDFGDRLYGTTELACQPGAAATRQCAEHQRRGRAP